MENHINFFWDGKPLTRFDNLNIKSFLINNHKVNIFTYNSKSFDHLKHKNLNITDANEILPKDKVFYYQGNGDCPLNSIGGFSDIFRYELLFKYGGWYVDFDTTCIKNFNSDFFQSKHIVLKPHNKFKVVSNTIKLPKDYHMLLKLKKNTEKCINEHNNEYIKPLKIFYNQILSENLLPYVVDKKYFGNDSMEEIFKFLNNYSDSINLLNERYCIHWCSTAVTTGKWNSRVMYDLNNPLPDSYLNYLYFKYES